MHLQLAAHSGLTWITVLEKLNQNLWLFILYVWENRETLHMTCNSQPINEERKMKRCVTCATRKSNAKAKQEKEVKN